MIKLGTPTCNYTAGEYSETPLSNVTLDNSINKGILKSWLTKASMPTARADLTSSVVDGKYCGYFNKDKTSVKIHGSKGTIDTSKPFVTWAQQHASRPFSLWEANSIEWAEVSMNTMFPRAYAKSTINKDLIWSWTYKTINI